MATDIDESLIQENIEEYVNDDNKIVTIRWLSLTLNIHINDAKRALTKFFIEHKGKQSDGDINATYFIAGLGKSKAGDPMHKCIVVPDSHLEEVKKNFSVVTSCHVYSVQKTKLKDYTSLYMTDFDIIRENADKSQSFSSIKCPWVEKKPKVEYLKSNVKSSDNKPTAAPPPTTSAPAAKAAAKKPQPKGSISSMFAATSKKNVSEEKAAPVKEEAAVNTANKASKPEAKKGSVLAMFNKQTNNKDDVKKTEAKNNSNSKESSNAKESITVTSSKTTNKTSVKVNNKRSLKSDKYEPRKKQRRRIKTDLFDSSDEDNNESEKESEEEVDVLEDPHVSDDEIIDNSVESIHEVNEVSSEKDTPPEEEGKNSTILNENKIVTVGQRGEKRKRTKKVVTKTFVDEEGFIVTTKDSEWQSETDDSESENGKTEEKTPSVVAPPLKSSTAKKTEPKSKEIPKKNISPRKGKQTSLMSFFKKS